jgi:hypothetical protein
MAMAKSIGIILLLTVGLFLGVLASVHAQVEPTLQGASIENSTGPFNPNQPEDDPVVRRLGA